jgi:DNA-binding FrmR family transcriptional regulator
LPQLCECTRPVEVEDDRSGAAEQDKDCLEVLQQVHAVRGALGSLGKVVLVEETCKPKSKYNLKDLAARLMDELNETPVGLEQ